MKIAVVRGDFASQWEIPIFTPWAKSHEVILFLGLRPVYKLEIPNEIKVVKLFSPVDLNFGKINRYTMAILNRIFIDAHVLFGLIAKLKGFDVVYTAETFYFYSLQVVIAKKLGFVKKVVMHVGENILNNNEGIWGKRLLKHFVIKNTDVFVAITDQAKKVLIAEGADPKKITRLNLGVDLNVFKPSKQKKDTKNVRLLIISRLIPEKGLIELAKMFTRLTLKYKNIVLDVVGVGPLYNQLKKYPVNLLGRVDAKKLPEIYSKADIFLHYPVGSKTWLEQFGFVLVEAMACGTPVLGLDRGSVKEVVGQGGIVVSEKEYEKTLIKLIENKKLRQQVGDKAQKLAREKYDVEKFSKSVLSLLSGLPG